VGTVKRFPPVFSLEKIMKYVNSNKSGQYLMTDGKALVFVHGVYETENEKEIAELDACSKIQGTTISRFDAAAPTGATVDVRPEKLVEAAANILAAHKAAQINPNASDKRLQELLEKAKATAALVPSLGAVSTADVKDAAKG
jgi:hypothetical protein